MLPNSRTASAASRTIAYFLLRTAPPGYPIAFPSSPETDSVNFRRFDFVGEPLLALLFVLAEKRYAGRNRQNSLLPLPQHRANGRASTEEIRARISLVRQDLDLLSSGSQADVKGLPPC